MGAQAGALTLDFSVSRTVSNKSTQNTKMVFWYISPKGLRQRLATEKLGCCCKKILKNVEVVLELRKGQRPEVRAWRKPLLW